MKRIAVYAGSFDPPTLGHMDIIKRAEPHFDELYILVAQNTSKSNLFTAEERVRLIKDSAKEMGLNIKVETDHELVVDFCKKVGAKVLIRGIRAVSDFEKEFQIATMNRHLDSSIESMHIMTDEKYFYLSSSLVKEVAIMGTDLKGLVPAPVEKVLKQKLSEKKGD